MSRFPQLSLSQGVPEQILCDYLHAHGVQVERCTTLETLEIDQNATAQEDSHPVQVKLRNDAEEGISVEARTPPEMRADTAIPLDYTKREILSAKYVVGCDGGHSTVRQQLDIKHEGEKTTKHFGVMDIVPLTDFRT